MSTSATRVRAFEPWMISRIGVGAAMGSFLTLLVPPFVADVTGSATRVGLVFAIVSLAAALGPMFARIADRTGWHAQFYIASLLLIAASFALLGIDAQMARWSPVFGLIVGVAMAVQGTIGSTFIVGARLSRADTARQLTAFNLTSPIGQLFGALVVALAMVLNASTQATFWIAAIVLAVFAVVTIPFIRAPAARLVAATGSAAPATGPAEPARTTGSAGTKAPAKPRVLVGAFAVFLVGVFIASAGNSGFASQIANIMPKVYGFSSMGTALLLGLAGLLNVGVIVWAGWWLGRSTALTVYTVGTLARGIGGVLMAVVGLFTSPVLILAAVAMLFTYQTVPLTRLSGAPLTGSLASGSVTIANGYYFAATALGSVVGSLSAGLLADVLSYNSVNWLAGLTSLAAAGILVFGVAGKQGQRGRDPS